MRGSADYMVTTSKHVPLSKSEGSKGSGPVKQLLPRLRAILAGSMPAMILCEILAQS